MDTGLKDKILSGDGSRLATAEQRLRQRGIKLPAAPEPFGIYAAAVRTGNLLLAVHGLVSQPVFRLGSGVAVLLLIPKAARLGAGLNCGVEGCRKSQSYVRVGIWLVLCRCSHGDGAGCHLCLADTQALPLGRTRKYGGGTR